LRRLTILLVLLLALSGRAWAAEELFDEGQLRRALPESAEDMMEGITPEAPGDFSAGAAGILSKAISGSRGALRGAAALCCQILAAVILCAVVRGAGGMAQQGANLAGILTVGAVCAGRISGFFALASETVDSISAFSGFLFSTLAAVTAAAGAAGTASSLYGITVMLCGLMTRVAQRVMLPGISCYMALSIAGSAVGDGALKPAADTLKLLMTNFLKFGVLAFTAYLSLTGVVGGSMDAAAVKAARLAISSAVPVVGSIVADASETLLVSASVLRSGIGIFGMLGVLAVSVTPFLETGCQYLMLKLTAAAAGAAGEKELAGLIADMAGAMGLLAGLTGACAAVLTVACVCFMKASV